MWWATLTAAVFSMSAISVTLRGPSRRLQGIFHGTAILLVERKRRQPQLRISHAARNLLAAAQPAHNILTPGQVSYCYHLRTAAMKRHSAFTLIELLVVIAIIAILI